MTIDLTWRFVTDGVISLDQLREAEAVASRLRVSVDTALLQLKYIDERLLAKSRAEAYGMEFVELETFVIPELSRVLIPESVARTYVCIALDNGEELLSVAIVDPLNFDYMDNLHLVLNRKIAPVIAMESQIRAAIDRSYGSIERESSDHRLVGEFWDPNIVFENAATLKNQDKSSTNPA